MLGGFVSVKFNDNITKNVGNWKTNYAPVDWNAEEVPKLGRS